MLALTNSPHECDLGEIIRARTVIARVKGE